MYREVLIWVPLLPANYKQPWCNLLKTLWSSWLLSSMPGSLQNQIKIIIGVLEICTLNRFPSVGTLDTQLRPAWKSIHADFGYQSNFPGSSQMFFCQTFVKQEMKITQRSQISQTVSILFVCTTLLWKYPIYFWNGHWFQHLCKHFLLWYIFEPQYSYLSPLKLFCRLQLADLYHPLLICKVFPWTTLLNLHLWACPTGDFLGD